GAGAEPPGAHGRQDHPRSESLVFDVRAAEGVRQRSLLTQWRPRSQPRSKDRAHRRFWSGYHIRVQEPSASQVAKGCLHGGLLHGAGAPAVSSGAGTFPGGVMITQLKFVGIPIADQERALRFYTEKLGFTVATDQPFSDQQRWIELRVANSPTRVVLFTPDGHEN